MQPVVMHVDTERGFRGGQQQALYLHTQLLQAGVQSWFAVPAGAPLRGKLPPGTAIPYRFLGEFDILSGLYLAAQARRRGVNIVHAHSAHALAVAIYIKRFMPRCKVVATRRVDFRVKGFWGRHKYMRADVNVCISQEIERVMLACGLPQSKLRVIRSGVDTARFVGSQPDYGYLPPELRGSYVVGTVAALAGHKDYPNLLRAAEICLRQNPNLVFVALGDGPLREEILAQAAHEPLRSRVLFLGHREDVGSILKTFNLFVLASRREGLGTSIIDAMALGLPVVATDAGGIPELIRHCHTGLLVTKQNAQALAEGILELVNNPTLAASLGAKARAEVNQFDMQTMAAANLALYEELLHG